MSRIIVSVKMNMPWWFRGFPLVLMLFCLVSPRGFSQERNLVIVPRERKHAILIGINKYAKPIEPLRYCVSDMDLLAKTLVKIGFPKENIVLMTDEAEKTEFLPTKTNIEKQFENIVGTVLDGDMVFIAFSGHGASDKDQSFLCPSDTNPNRTESMVSRTWISELLETSPAKHQIFLVDACRNELFAGGAKAVSGIKSLDTEWEPLPGIFQLSSCSAKQQSWEDPKLRHGVFTHYIVQGLTSGQADTNRDGSIDILEMFKYAQQSTITHVREEFNEPQRPTMQILGEFSDVLVLADATILPINPQPPPPPPPVGTRVDVSTSQQLKNILDNVEKGEQGNVVIVLAPGTYRLDKSYFINGNTVSLYGNPSRPEDVKIVADEHILVNERSLCLDFSGETQGTIIGCDIAGREFGVFISDKRTNVTLKFCNFHDMADGLFVCSGSTALMENCEIYNVNNGIHVRDDSRITVRDSTIHKCKNNGINLLGTTQADVSGCKIYDNGSYGIDAYSPGVKGTFRNNTLYGNKNGNWKVGKENTQVTRINNHPNE